MSSRNNSQKKRAGNRKAQGLGKPSSKADGGGRYAEEADGEMQLIEKAVDLRGSQILNIDSYQAIKWHRRLMAVTAVLAWIGFIIYVIAVFIPKWATISFRNTEGFDVSVDLGVWGEWRSISRRNTKPTAEWFPHFPSPPDNVLRLNMPELNHYYRAQAVMCIIAMVIFLGTNLLAVYTFFHHRFIYKRLTAGLYVIIGFTIFVSIEVLTNSVNAWNKEAAEKSLTDDFDYENHQSIGISTRLAQGSMATAFIAAIIFLLGSHKQKGDKAATTDLEIEDRPIHVGR
ncbi:hypothetical protein WR25_13051 [Diploscapter pachys]|uniref:Uncharacterized protein n=1 Tax=Diploscapter pachys TaxID=2018661 RepID=A0A2A2JUF0_9BILA|nr:hypothetical protein WR25_13051 [Diploscapter pachys]